MWTLNKEIPFSNNVSERSLRSSKTKMKVSGQFENINSARNYANIKSYLETGKRHGYHVSEVIKRDVYKRQPLRRPHGKRAGHRRLQRLPPPGGGEGPPRRRGSLGPLPGRGGNAPCLRRIQEGRPRLLRKPGVYGQQAPAELQKEPHTRGAVTASLFSPGNDRNPRGFYEENVKNQKF